MHSVRVEVLCVGSELLSGKINTHTSWLAQTLRRIGLSIARESALKDSVEEIRAAVKEAYARSQVLIICGGLGPTFDDVTREGTAEALETSLRYRPEVYAQIHARLRKYYRRREIPEENKRQAYFLEGSEVLHNNNGAAPGQMLRRGEKTAVLLPGPPRELYPMFENIMPKLKTWYAPRTFSQKAAFHLCGITETDADHRLQPLLSKPADGVEYTILASLGMVDFHVTATAQTPQAVARLLQSARKKITRLVGKYIYGTDAETLESVVGDRLRRKKLRLAAAESCTGGLLSERLTSVSGSSDYYLGGIISYSNTVKQSQLGVRPATLKKYGAVSASCAREMAEGAIRRLNGDIAVSITGIAGPSGGTPKKPVGLTFIGLARKGRPTQAQRFLFAGDRSQIRERAAVAALTCLFRSLH